MAGTRSLPPRILGTPPSFNVTTRRDNKMILGFGAVLLLLHSRDKMQGVVITEPVGSYLD